MGVVADFLQLSVMLEGLDSEPFPPFAKSISRRIARMAQVDDLKHLGVSLKASRIAKAVFGERFARAMQLD